VTEKKLEGIRVAILATDGVQHAELSEPRRALEEAGARTTLIAPKLGKIYAVKHGRRVGSFTVALELAKADPNDFDAVLLPGGTLNADALRAEPKAKEFVQQIDAAGKPIAVICHGGWLLVSAGLVRGRTITSYHTIQDDMRNAGANWVDRDVVRDNNWVSSRQPSDFPAFNREMLRLMGERRAWAAGA